MPCTILPDEVLIGILELCDAKSLAILSRASKRLYSLAHEILYSMTIDNQQLDTKDCRLLPAFLQKIRSEPGFSQQVTAFTSRAEYTEGTEKAGIAGDEGRGEFEWCHSLTRETDYASIWKYYPDLRKHVGDRDGPYTQRAGTWQSLAAMLLCLLPNIRSVELYGYRDSEDCLELLSIPLLAQCFQVPSDVRPSVMICDPKYSIRKPSDEDDAHADRGGLWQVVPFISLRSITSVTLIDAEDHLTLSFEGVQSFDHITDLSILQSAINTKPLQGFLRLFPSLKRFTYGISQLGPGAVLAALDKAIETLEELAIKSSGRARRRNQEFQMLSCLKKLRSIEIMADVLSEMSYTFGGRSFGSRVRWSPTLPIFVGSLPQSIEHIIFTSCLPEVLRFFVAWLGGNPPQSLAKVTLGFEKGYNVSSLRETAFRDGWEYLILMRGGSSFEEEQDCCTWIWHREGEPPVNLWSS